MCGYDPFYWLDIQLAMEHDMWERGIEDVDEYYQVIADEKEQAEIAFWTKDR